MKIEITEEEIKENKDFLIKEFGKGNLNNMSKRETKRVILLKRLKENIINCKKGDIIYKFNDYKNILESKKEFVVYKKKESIFGKTDISINNGNGYISGGLNGKAVLKRDWEQYKKELEVLK